MLRPSVLVLALVLTARAWWVAVIDNEMPVLMALIWFLVAVPISALVLAGFRSLAASYRRSAAQQRATRPAAPDN